MILLRRLYAHNFKQLQEIELHFPERARVLVQGKNEAGKSTLFEAVFFALFGTALVTETGSRSLDDLIRYGIEKAEVELDAQVGARLFKIKRKIVRGKSNTWELDILEDGRGRDEIRGNAPVNKRLVDELGFDGDALLNTCFVEQKKLEKLEGLSRAKREESLAKLLNLDSLVELESDFKITADDRRELERVRKRAELAEIQDELPKQERELTQVERDLRLVDLRAALEDASDELVAVKQLDTQILELAQRRDETAARVARLDELREAMQNVKAAMDTRERAEEGGKEIERLRAELNQARRAVEDVPKLQARARDLARLARHLERLGEMRAARDRFAERVGILTGAAGRVAEFRATVVREEATNKQIDARVHEYEIGEALGDWIAARREVPVALQAEDAVRAKQIARDQIGRRLQVETYALAGLLLAFLGAALFVESFALFFFGMAALALFVLALRGTMQWRALARAAQALGEAQGEARALTLASESQHARVRQADARLAQLGIAIPATIESAHSQRVRIAREMDVPRQNGEELRTEQAAARERLFSARAVLSELEQQNEIDDSANLEEERAECERAVKKVQGILARWEPRVEKHAQALQVVMDLGAAQRALFQVDAQVEQLRWRTNDAARFTQEITKREEQTKALWARARDAYENARGAGTQHAAPTWDPSLVDDDYNAFGKNLRKEYEGLGGEDAVRHSREIEGELGRRQGERNTRARNADLLIERVRELTTQVGGEISKTPTLDDLSKLRKRFQALKLDDESTLRARHRELVGRARSLQDRRMDLEQELGLAGEQLDRAECQRERIEYERALRVRERSVELVSFARRGIVQKVLPTTMDYMRQILPALTRDRYHDAQLDEETYKIQVWDERAGGTNGQGGSFKEKNIFSGGTKDQFSLALRLAFALATLPQQRGSAPSFIFLDEPLGSFDDERADALIYLLTEGEIAQAFDQIFLISHVRVDERLFTHRIQMEHGHVAFTDLPSESEASGIEKRRRKVK